MATTAIRATGLRSPMGQIRLAHGGFAAARGPPADGSGRRQDEPRGGARVAADHHGVQLLKLLDDLEGGEEHA